MASAVLDANAVIGLAKGSVFHHLANLYSDLYVPTAVVHEVTVQGSGRPGAAELAGAVGAWIDEVTPDPSWLAPLIGFASPADREVVAVARHKGVDHILSDDSALKREAIALGMDCLGVPEVVVLLKHAGLIAAVGPILDGMIQAGFGISASDYRQARTAAGE